MTVEIRGPMTPQEIPRYQLAVELLAAYEEIIADNDVRLVDMPDSQEKRKIQRSTDKMRNLCFELRAHYGSRSDRVKDPFVREVEGMLGVEINLEDEDQETS